MVLLKNAYNTIDRTREQQSLENITLRGYIEGKRDKGKKRITSNEFMLMEIRAGIGRMRRDQTLQRTRSCGDLCPEGILYIIEDSGTEYASVSKRR